MTSWRGVRRKSHACSSIKLGANLGKPIILIDEPISSEESRWIVVGIVTVMLCYIMCYVGVVTTTTPP